ncbi:MAG: response regulator transcription factor [Caloramator sp.]|nr:response regulator transcription factor [Caloramator sp.]
MQKLLLVEDDKALSMGIEFTLKDEGYNVLTANTEEEAKYLLEKEKIDLAILDVNLPDGSGYELCKYIKGIKDIPIIFLTVLDEEVNVVLGFEYGADDYITKPFRIRELVSRIKAVLRRYSKDVISGSRLISEDIELDLAAATVKKKGKVIGLTAQEYKLILILMSNPKIVIDRDSILKELIGCDEAYYDENTLSVYIKRIREKLEDNPKEPKYIITKRGLGYKWDVDVVKG